MTDFVHNPYHDPCFHMYGNPCNEIIAAEPVKCCLPTPEEMEEIAYDRAMEVVNAKKKNTG